MAVTDRAIVAGIDKYPSLGDLDGPENDVQAFIDWLQSPSGGDVLPENIDSIRRLVPNPLYTNPVRPAYWEIEQAFGKLLDLAEQMQADPGWTGKIGRRLYIYLAGHGFDPAPEYTAILAADATRQKTGNHFLGKPYVDLLAQAALFEQIVLFVDCCRERDFKKVALNLPRLSTFIAPANERDAVGLFYAFAGRWTRKTRERPFPPADPAAGGPVVRGVFTKTLLTGLEGGAGDPATGVVTFESLSDFLYENLQHFLEDADLTDEDIASMPEVKYDPKDKGLVLVTVPPKTFQVTIRLAAVPAAGPLTILGDGFKPVGPPMPLNGAPVVVNLPRGTYQAQIAGVPSKLFEVTGTGAVDVTL